MGRLRQQTEGVKVKGEQQSSVPENRPDTMGFCSSMSSSAAMRSSTFYNIALCLRRHLKEGKVQQISKYAGLKSLSGATILIMDYLFSRSNVSEMTAQCAGLTNPKLNPPQEQKACTCSARVRFRTIGGSRRRPTLQNTDSLASDACTPPATPGTLCQNA